MGGDFAGVREQFEAMPRPETLDDAPYARSLTYVALTMSQFNRQVPGCCVETAVNALRDAERSGIQYSHLHAAYAALECLARGDVAQGRIWLRRTGGCMDRISPQKGELYYIASCCLELCSGNLAGALQSGRQAVEMATATSFFYTEGIARLFLAQALLEAHDADAVEEQVTAIEAVVNRGALEALRFPLELLRAECLARSGRDEEGLATLRDAMKLGKRTGARRALLIRPLTTRICTRALANDIRAGLRAPADPARRPVAAGRAHRAMAVAAEDHDAGRLQTFQGRRAAGPFAQNAASTVHALEGDRRLRRQGRAPGPDRRRRLARGRLYPPTRRPPCWSCREAPGADGGPHRRRRPSRSICE